MLLVMFHSQTGKGYLAQQTPDFRFNRLDSDGGRHMYGKYWVNLDRYKVGPREWIQIGPLNMIQWSKE